MADVYSYDTSQKPMMDIPIVSGGTAYDDTSTNKTYILVFNEALYYGLKLSHTLINPNQCRHYGLEFNDNPYDNEKGLCIMVNDELTILMTTKGTKVLFHTRVPTKGELETCIHIEMTGSELWNPNEINMIKTISSDIGRATWVTHCPRVAEVVSIPNNSTELIIWEYQDPVDDEALMHSAGSPIVWLHKRYRTTSTSTSLCELTRAYDDRFMDVQEKRTYVSTDHHLRITMQQVAERFCIGPIRARATLLATTQ